MADDPRWPRASAWLAGDHVAPSVARLGVTGAPLTLGSITPGRCDLAPEAIRRALFRFSTWHFESSIDVRSVAAEDLGDLNIAHLLPDAAFDPLSSAVRGALDGRDAVAILGGDNSVTRPGVHGLGIPLERCGVLTIDAHLDLRDVEPGLTNGNPIRALLADGLPGANVVQMGIQSFANSPQYATVAQQAGIQVITAEEVANAGITNVVTQALSTLAASTDVIYVDLDLDVMDRMFVPGTPGSRPGGLSPMDIRSAARVCGRHPKVRAIDLVEFDPTHDIGDTTALAAAACLLSFAVGLAERMKAW